MGGGLSYKDFLSLDILEHIEIIDFINDLKDSQDV